VGRLRITIYLAQAPVDFRLGINGLSVLVEATLRFDRKRLMNDF